MGGVTAPPPGDACGQTLTADGTVSGQWAAGCESQERDGRHARYYTFNLAQQSSVTVTLESDDADTYLYLREGEARSGAFLHENDDHQGSLSVSQIQETLPAGTYTIEATTYGAGETGNFTLTVAGLGGVTAPPPGDACGQTLTADGTVSGQWAAGCESQERDGRHARYYTFNLAQQSSVTVTLESDDADTYLYLREGEARSGAFLHENDDHQGSLSVSQIQETLSAGSYTIEATTYSGGETGGFTLTLSGLGGGTAPPPVDACDETLAGDGSVSGQWAAGCDSQERAGRHARYYTFNLAQDSEVTITLESNDADTYLYLRQGEARSGAFLHENDDHQGSLSVSQVQASLAAGSYTIEATTYSAGETGSFTLTVAGPIVISVVSALAPLGSNLLWILHYDNATSSWFVYDPSGTFGPSLISGIVQPPIELPDLSDLRPLTHLHTGAIYFLEVTQNQTVTIAGETHTLHEGINLFHYGG